MRISFLPYSLTSEDAWRLYDVLRSYRYGEVRTLRDLARRHRIYPRVVEAAFAAGLVRIEKRQPHTGRPSILARLEPDAVNKCPPAKLPSRLDRPQPSSFREEDFLRHYLCRRGMSAFWKRGTGSAADAYRKVYGQHRRITDGTARSAGARLARQPWMKAAFYLERRLMGHGGRLRWPVDLRSAAREWWQLIQGLNQGFGDWPADVAQIIRTAKTHPEAREGLKKLERFSTRHPPRGSLGLASVQPPLRTV
jgi:hypothetical protein